MVQNGCEISLSGLGDSIPECCPTNLIIFENKIIKTFKPNPGQRHVSRRGMPFFCHTRESVAYKDLLSACEISLPALPSLIIGPKRGFQGALYVGNRDSATFMEFLKIHRIDRIVMTTKLYDLDPSRVKLWRDLNIKVLELELDPGRLESSNACCFMNVFKSNTKHDANLETRTMTQVVKGLSFMSEGLRKGGVLLVDPDGFGTAAALASIFLASVIPLPLRQAFKIVKSARSKANPDEAIFKIMQSFLGTIVGEGEKKPKLTYSPFDVEVFQEMKTIKM